MAFRKLPQSLRRSIQEYFEARYEGCVFNEETIIKMLNPGLQKVVVETSKSWHLQSPNCPIGYCSEEFINECSNLMKSETYLTNDIIIKPNAFVRNVIFIDKGFKLYDMYGMELNCKDLETKIFRKKNTKLIFLLAALDTLPI